MAIQLRYTDGSLWNVELVNPKTKGFKEHYNRVLDYQKSYVRSNWRHLLSYFLGDKEMKKNVLDKSKDALRKNVISWMFRIQHPGVEHRDIYVVLTDVASDFRSGMLCGKISSTTIWKSITESVDAFLREKIDKVEPVEYEMITRYYSCGVAKRESKDNELWCYTKEEDRRRHFGEAVSVDEILVRKEV